MRSPQAVRCLVPSPRKRGALFGSFSPQAGRRWVRRTRMRGISDEALARQESSPPVTCGDTLSPHARTGKAPIEIPRWT
jgi:hypothetical protein